MNYLEPVLIDVADVDVGGEEDDNQDLLLGAMDFGLGKTAAEKRAEKEAKKAAAAEKKAEKVAAHEAAKAAKVAAREEKKKVKLSTGHVVEASPAEAAKGEAFLKQARADLAALQAEKASLVAKLNAKRAKEGKSALHGFSGLEDLGVTNLDTLLASTATSSNPFGAQQYDQYGNPIPQSTGLFSTILPPPRGYARRMARGRPKSIDLYYQLSASLQSQLSALMQQITATQNEILQLLQELESGGITSSGTPAPYDPYAPTPGTPSPYPPGYDPNALQSPAPATGMPTGPVGPGGYMPTPQGYQEVGTEALGPDVVGGGEGGEGDVSWESGLEEGYAPVEYASGDIALPDSGVDSGGILMSEETGYVPYEDYGSAEEYSLTGLGLGGVRDLG